MSCPSLRLSVRDYCVTRDAASSYYQSRVPILKGDACVSLCSQWRICNLQKRKDRSAILAARAPVLAHSVPYGSAIDDGPLPVAERRQASRQTGRQAGRQASTQASRGKTTGKRLHFLAEENNVRVPRPRYLVPVILLTREEETSTRKISTKIQRDGLSRRQTLVSTSLIAGAKYNASRFRVRCRIHRSQLRTRDGTLCVLSLQITGAGIAVRASPRVIRWPAHCTFLRMRITCAIAPLAINLIPFAVECSFLTVHKKPDRTLRINLIRKETKVVPVSNRSSTGVRYTRMSIGIV